MNHLQNNSKVSRSGFTLVEMLISVGLVLLMMTLFAQIFSMATESVQRQQANGENDQRIRTMSTIIRADFAKRTMRRVQPFYPGETKADSPTSFASRRGYFYLSTNNAVSGLDDVVQFTISAEEVSENSDTTQTYGRARQLIDRAASDNRLVANVNQPELDDGTLTADFTATSGAAQVCYFIRNGNLYRRLLLLREPLNVGGSTLEPQPRSGDGRDYFAGYTDDSDPAGTFDGFFAVPGSTGAVAIDDFYTHFDFSAIAKPQVLGGTTVRTAGFVGSEALSNDPGDSGQFPLGIPHHRFGFHQFTGLSHEYLNTEGNSFFLGRYLHAETSSPNFNWPQQPATNEAGTATLWSRDRSSGGLPGVDGDPFETVDRGTHNYSLNNFGIVNEFDSAPANGLGGSRAVEDLLLSNVHEFRVELWDERLQDYVTPGHSRGVGGIQGDFHAIRRLTALSGPGGNHARNAFDTWHPDIASVDSSYGGPNPQYPPYLPFVYRPPIAPGPAESGNLGWYNVNSTYSAGDVVFGFRDDPNGVGGGTAGEHDPGVDEPVLAGFQRAYKCIYVDPAVTSPPPLPGALIGRPSTTIGQRIIDGHIVWQVVDNTQPVTSARIRIRFVNSKTEKIRQLTLIVALSDED